MAYFTQDMKKAIAPAIKALSTKYGIKCSLAVRDHSVVVLNIKSGKINFFGSRKPTNTYQELPADVTYAQVNHYHIDTNYSGSAAEFLNAAKDILNTGNHNRSDSQSDYFDVGHYVDINIGNWDTPYVLEA
jgi:hypothetical protein